MPVWGMCVSCRPLQRSEEGVELPELDALVVVKYQHGAANPT